jgi:hypothetical protein
MLSVAFFYSLFTLDFFSRCLDLYIIPEQDAGFLHFHDSYINCITEILSIPPSRLVIIHAL